MTTTLETVEFDRAVAIRREDGPMNLGFLTLNSDILSKYGTASAREWLVTNGIGGYASASLAGANTRRYHGLLVAALTPPTGRTVLLSKVEETATLDGNSLELSANQYPGTIHPKGFRLLESFRPWPAAEFQFRLRKDVVLSKRIWMEHGRNTTYVQYTLVKSPVSIGLRLTPLTCFKDYHSEFHANPGFPHSLSLLEQEGSLKLKGSPDGPELRILVSGAGWERADFWNYNVEHAREMERGLDWREDLYCPGHFLLGLSPGQSVTLVGTIENEFQAPEDSWRELLKRQQYLIAAAGAKDDYACALALAADAFVIEQETFGQRVPARSSSSNANSPPASHHSPSRSTIIAGYHWFSDWGRDTMISLPGLCVSTGRLSVAREILLSFAEYISDGMLPNRFPDRGEQPEYNTVDATLWYFQALWEYFLKAPDDLQTLRTLWPNLKEIIDWHLRGTRYGIGVDETDGLLRAGAPGVQLTWMDARVGDWVVTPRIGKPVEINALWYNALRVMENLSEKVQDYRGHYSRLAQRAESGFKSAFVRSDGLGLYDVISPDGPDQAIRPNQVFAVSLPHSPISKAIQRKVVDVVAEHLLTPAGLRTLAPDDTAYKSVYRGGPSERDGAYHQGTVWPWLLGPFVEAHLRVYEDKAAAKNLIVPLIERLSLQGIGFLSEIADAEPPHAPNGCIAQAWSVAESLRLWKLLGN